MPWEREVAPRRSREAKGRRGGKVRDPLGEEVIHVVLRDRVGSRVIVDRDRNDAGPSIVLRKSHASSMASTALARR